MSSNQNAKQLDVNFSSGLRQDLEGKVAPPGVLVQADNVEFDQLNRLVRRDGFTSLGIGTYSKSAGLTNAVRRIVEGGSGERLLFTDSNSYVHFPAPNKVSTASLAQRVDNVRATLESTYGVSASETGSILFADCAAVGTYVVYATLAVDPTSGTPTLYADVLDTITNARVISSFSLGSADSSSQPRVVASGGSSVAFILWGTGAATINYSKIDLSGSTVSQPTAAAALVTDSETLKVFDVDTCASGWVLVYGQSNGTHQARVATFDSTPAQTHTFQWLDNAGASNWTPSVLAICGDSQASSSNICVAGYDPATFKAEMVRVSNVLAGAAYANVDPGLNHAKHAKVMAVSRQTSTVFECAFSNYTSTPLTSNPRGHLYCYTLTATPSWSLDGVFANYTLASKFYRDAASGGLFATARFDDPSGLQNHLLLLDFGYSSSGYGFPVPHSSFASGRLQLGSDNALTGLGGMANLSGSQAGAFQLVYPINAAASQVSGNQVQAYNFLSLSPRRYLPALAQGCSVVSGGTPLIYDGLRLVELSFYSYPVVGASSFTPAAAGGTLGQGIYQYRLVYEWTDAKGNRHQSPASPAQSVDMSSATYVAGTNQVSIAIPELHATRKQQSHPIGGGAGDISAPVRVILYRTKAGGQVFYRCPQASVNITTSAADTTITDTASDTSIGVNEPLYTAQGGRGLLASTAPPLTMALTTHQQRLWGVDCENFERIWCTRILQTLDAPAYSPALQVLIPGAGRINGLAGQDGKLYALATNGIYLASYGDGPDDTGAGVFPTPQLITTTANCSDPRGVFTGQDGIFFAGKDQWGTGIYLIRRGDGNPISIGKRIRTELAAYPVCRGIVNRTSKARTEFLFVDSDTAPTAAIIAYYHHDYSDQEGIGQWTVAKVASALECIATWNDVSVVGNSTPAVGIQTPGSATADFGGSTPSVQIATADFRPFGLVGYGQQTGITLLGTSASADPIKVELSYDSGATWADSTQYIATSESAGAPVLRAFMPPTSKLPSGGSVRVRLSDPTLGGSNPGTTYFHGFSIEVLPLGGNARLADTQRA